MTYRFLFVLDSQVESGECPEALLGLLARLVQDLFELVAAAHVVQQLAAVHAQALGQQGVLLLEVLLFRG